MKAQIETAAEQGRVAKRRARVRERIVRVAERLMTERGVDEVTIDEIAEAADIARRSFYHHFDSKHDLLVPIARARAKTLTARIDRALADIDDPAEVMAAGMRYGLREIPADSLCSWFVLHSGLPDERLYEGMGKSGMRDAMRAVEAGRFHISDVRIAPLLVAGAFVATIRARSEARLSDEDLDDAVEYLLRLFGLGLDEAHDIAHRPLRALPPGVHTNREYQ